MCTVTLSYNKNDAAARQALIALLATGLFTQLDISEGEVDCVEPNSEEAAGADDVEFNAYMCGVKQRIPDRNMSLEEAYQVVMGEIGSIYKMKDAV